MGLDQSTLFLSQFSLVRVEPARSDKEHQSDRIRGSELLKQRGSGLGNPERAAATGGQFQAFKVAAPQKYFRNKLKMKKPMFQSEVRGLTAASVKAVNHLPLVLYFGFNGVQDLMEPEIQAFCK